MLKSLGVVRVIAILLGGAIALWLSTAITLSLTIARQAPAIVQSWWPASVMAKVTLGQQLLIGARQPEPQTVDSARASLRDAALREPVNTEALGTLATLDEYRKDQKRARALFLASEAVSRRNTLSQFWLIEDAVGRGDIAGAITHYNRAMLVSNESRTTLIPVLVGASSDPNIIKALMPLLARRPLWWRDYMTQLGKSGDNAAAMMAALHATRLDVRNPDDAVLAQDILRRLVAIGAGGSAIIAANRLEGLPGITRSLRDGGFETPVNVLPFAWWLRDEPSIRAYRDTVPNGSIGLRVSTNSGTGGGVAQQMIGLAPGQYVLVGQAGGIPADPTARPTIDITCGTGTPLMHAILASSGEDGSGFRFVFHVPAMNCPLQWISIATAPAVDTDMWIDNLSITR